MFDFHNKEGIKSYRDEMQGKILGSFKIDDNPAAQASLIKGLTVEDFDVQYPTDKFQRFSYESLTKAKDELSKGEISEKKTVEELSKGMTPVVVQNGNLKKLFYVREKPAA